MRRSHLTGFSMRSHTPIQLRPITSWRIRRYARDGVGQLYGYAEPEYSKHLVRAIFRSVLRSSSLYESQIESDKHQDNPDIHNQPFPKVTPEEQKIHADDYGDQQDYVNDDNYVSFHVTARPNWGDHSP